MQLNQWMVVKIWEVLTLTVSRLHVSYRQKLWIRGELDGLHSLWGGSVGANEGQPQRMGGGSPPTESDKLFQDSSQIVELPITEVLKIQSTYEFSQDGLSGDLTRKRMRL